MRKYVVLAVAAMGLSLSGCATMSQEQCLNSNWRRVGFHDGANGYPKSRLGDHIEACAAYAVRPNSAAYFAARIRGLAVYCTPLEGFTDGRQGHAYNDVCPAPLARGFLRGYDDGQRMHVVEYELESARDDVRALENRIAEIDDETDAVRDQLAGPSEGKVDRDALQDQLRHLRDERDRARRELLRLDDRAQRARYDVARLRRLFVPIYGPW